MPLAAAVQELPAVTVTVSTPLGSVATFDMPGSVDRVEGSELREGRLQAQLSEGLGGVPLLPGCMAVFQCSVEYRYEGGDHIILIGRVEHLTTRSTAPLLFYRGRYAVPEYEQSADQKRVRLTLDT